MGTSSVVTCRQVSEHFLRLEADKGDALAIRLSSAIFSNDVDFFEQYRAYASVCKNEERDSPVLVWTVGVPGDYRFQDVSEWRLEKVNLDEMYSCAMGRNIKVELDAVGGNLKAFTASVKKNLACYPEFDLARIPSDVEKQTAIGVAHSVTGRQGSIELIDAAHRVVSMIANGMGYTFAYLAVLKR